MRTIWQACVQGALERVFLPLGGHVCSSERVHLSGCAYHLAGMCAGALTIWQACVQF